MTSPPLVTVAMPLCRSHAFLPTILDNLRALTYPNLEILVSDRHRADEALPWLREQCQGDQRIRFLESDDQAGWVSHYNALLREARGTYFLWMPHDDRYPPGYIDKLVAALEATPDAVGAFGVMHIETRDRPEVDADWAFAPPPAANGPWSARVAGQWLLFWNFGYAFRGLFRRAPIVARQVYIKSTYQSVNADLYWVFGVALQGPLVFVPAAACVKLYHPGGASAVWRTRFRTRLEGVRLPAAYLRDTGVPRRDAAKTMAVIVTVAVLRAALQLLPRRWRSRSPPQRIRTALSDRLRRLLS